MTRAHQGVRRRGFGVFFELPFEQPHLSPRARVLVASMALAKSTEYPSRRRIAQRGGQITSRQSLQNPARSSWLHGVETEAEVVLDLEAVNPRGPVPAELL